MYKAVNVGSLGEAVLVNTLSSAYYALTKSQAERIGKRIKEGKECLALIQNSGIHQITQIFGLDIDPEKLEQLFFYYVDIA